ncbi:MAG: polyprenol monophosphomannose synthase [Candidatus Altiarchaeota archaeon]
MANVSVIVPTFNERDNLGLLVEELSRVCVGLDFEVVVADDDSPDGTGELADELAKKFPVVALHRKVDKGLSPAVIDGFARASGEVFVVMDADLSHPPELVPRLVEKVSEGFDVVYASRHVEGGGLSDWPFHRRLISRAASFLARGLTKSTDPMSGFFAVKRSVIEGVSLNPVGFKIGLEILVKGKYRKYGEVGFVFRDRAAGESKLDSRVYVDYVRHLLRLYAFKLKRL